MEKTTEKKKADDPVMRSERARKGGLALAAQRGRAYYVALARMGVEKRAQKKLRAEE